MSDLRTKDRLIVALDCDLNTATSLVWHLGGVVSFFKIGHQLAYAGGLDLAKQLVAKGQRVFLDLKLHDIPNTVEEGVRSLAGLGVDFLTVHAYPKTMEAALKGVQGSKTRVLGVTVLTSDNRDDLVAAGYTSSPRMLVTHRANEAAKLGMHGLVCSPHEAYLARSQFGSAPVTIVTPGIRPANSEANDQSRVGTPSFAIGEGADHLVVGRPITAAHSPRAAAQAILKEIALCSSAN